MKFLNNFIKISPHFISKVKFYFKWFGIILYILTFVYIVYTLYPIIVYELEQDRIEHENNPRKDDGRRWWHDKPIIGKIFFSGSIPPFLEVIIILFLFMPIVLLLEYTRVDEETDDCYADDERAECLRSKAQAFSEYRSVLNGSMDPIESEKIKKTMGYKYFKFKIFISNSFKSVLMYIKIKLSPITNVISFIFYTIKYFFLAIYTFIKNIIVLFFLYLTLFFFNIIKIILTSFIKNLTTLNDKVILFITKKVSSKNEILQTLKDVIKSSKKKLIKSLIIFIKILKK